jgi:LysM repeat protein
MVTNNIFPGNKIYRVFLFMFFVGTQLHGQSSYDVQVHEYIERYKEIAVQEMMIYRIPASITLAQGIFESNAGKSRLATEANNHFGIKCHKEWTGKTFIQDDETRNECFRKYDTPEESFRDHSYFLTQRDRYKPLFSLDITDYKSWANGLKEAGYATNPQYPQKLINAIETYDLSKLDIADFSNFFSDSLIRKPADTIRRVHPPEKYELFAVGPGNRNVYINNGLQFLIQSKNDNLRSVASAFGVSERKILKWNDLPKGASLVAGQIVYLENKKQNGAASFHVVGRGETMYTISQRYGIQLKWLYKRNSMKPGQVPKAGKKLLLR